MTGAPADEVGELLPGGHANRGRIRRAGDTVRRPLRPTSPSVHALLRHLEAVGFPGAPRVRGVDGTREVLDYVPGEVPGSRVPDALATDDALASVALLLRDYHHAARGFDAAAWAWPRRAPAAWAGSVVVHNDPNIDNVVFRGGRAVALIDFDLAAPADPLWDVALAVRLWAPLRDPVDVHDARQGQELRRARLFADAYGLAREERERLAAAVRDSGEWAYAAVEQAVDQGHREFAEYWRAKGGARAGRTRAWLEAHAAEVGDALR
ncbi:phosphotransferase family enzyme [Motilibacter rhizosphaerae]|uniref:Phosphotransferase family enzyme n=1 Tax=Motilibacter rhizosphaerae TaxID=598652 RepID=A0A4Q7NG09_9ACTN|nr:phosphotransferase [Motilibacter rhizosphaerae]RZS82831.1 phosphotransferase family enzyme [Motilibacter rhizosphaerae]